MVASGVPIPSKTDHVRDIASVALQQREARSKRLLRLESDLFLEKTDFSSHEKGDLFPFLSHLRIDLSFTVSL